MDGGVPSGRPVELGRVRFGSSDEVTANTWETIRLPASALDAPSWWLNFSKAGTVVDLASREDPAHAPQLIVTYAASDSSVPSPTTAPDPSPSGGDIVLGGVGDTNPDRERIDHVGVRA